MVSVLFVESLYNLLKRQQADIAVCSYEKSKNGVLHQTEGKIEYSISSEKMLMEWHGERKSIETVVWNKLYHKSVFGEKGNYIRFPEGREHEDVYVSHLLVENADKIAITDCKLYMYRVRKGSITGSKATEEKIRQDLEAQLARMEFFEKKGYVESLHRVVIGFLLHVVMYNWKIKFGIDEKKIFEEATIGSKELENELQKVFNKYYPRVAKSQELKGKNKILLKIAEKFVKVYNQLK